MRRLIVPLLMAAFFFYSCSGNDGPATVEINLSGKNHILHNPSDVSTTSVSASDFYQLTLRDSLNEKVLFFTWDAD